MMRNCYNTLRKLLMRNICIISETINQGQLMKGEVLMKWRIRIAIVSLCLIMLMLNGCGLFSLKDDLSPEERVSTSAAKTLEVLHGVETIVAMTLSAGNVEQATPDSTEPEKRKHLPIPLWKIKPKQQPQQLPQAPHALSQLCQLV